MRSEIVHPPTPGYYAAVPSSGFSDRVVVEYYNGVPSVLIVEIDGVPVLVWMLHGHDDDVRLWVYVPLSPAEVEEMTDSPPLLLTDWLAERPARTIYLGVADAEVLTLVVTWDVPRAPGAQMASLAVDAVLAELRRALLHELPVMTSRAFRDTESNMRHLVA